MVKKDCLICGVEFTVNQFRADKAKTCSLECRGKYIALGYSNARARLVCEAPDCGKEYSVPQCHEDRRKFCSVECSLKHRPMNPPTGKDHYLWKGGRTTHSDGYILLRAVHHPFSVGLYVFEHRLVMEQWMREESPNHSFLVEVAGELYLSPEISVHHIDEQKTHNVRSNLLACTNAAHRSIHAGVAPYEKEVWPEIVGGSDVPYRLERTCVACNETFHVKRADARRGQDIYCSRNCYDNRDKTPFEVTLKRNTL